MPAGRTTGTGLALCPRIRKREPGVAPNPLARRVAAAVAGLLGPWRPGPPRQRHSAVRPPRHAVRHPRGVGACSIGACRIGRDGDRSRCQLRSAAQFTPLPRDDPMTALQIAIVLACVLLGSSATLALAPSDVSPTTLVVIDFQDFYFRGGLLPLVAPEIASANAARLLEHARHAGPDLRPCCGHGDSDHAVLRARASAGPRPLAAAPILLGGAIDRLGPRRSPSASSRLSLPSPRSPCGSTDCLRASCSETRGFPCTGAPVGLSFPQQEP